MKPLPREGFNRSVAKSPFATTYRLRTSLARNKFQSLSREKPFCHDSEIARIAAIDNTFQSLSREKPFCHIVNRNVTDSSYEFQSLSREKPFCHGCWYRSNWQG